MGSAEPYPHADFLPWVETVIELCGWSRILWGSEYPVLYWRDENIPQAINWLEDLGVASDSHKRDSYLRGNAERILFADPAPPAEDVALPSWVEEQFDRGRLCWLFPNKSLDIPMEAYSRLLSDYIKRQGENQDLSFAGYISEQLVLRSREL